MDFFHVTAGGLGWGKLLLEAEIKLEQNDKYV